MLDPSGPQPALRAFDYDRAIIGAVRQEHKLLRFESPRLIDVGTGTAQLLIRLAEDPWFDSFELVGIDTSPDMLEVANDLLKQTSVADRIQLDEQDVHNLSYEDDYCEFVTSQSSVHQWENPVQAFKEIFRILKPHGVAVIHEPRRDLSPEKMVALKKRRAQLGISAAPIDSHLTPSETWDLIEEAGLAKYSMISSPSTSGSFEVRIANSTPVENTNTSLRTQSRS